MAKKKTEEVVEETVVEETVEKNPWSEGTSKYQEWAAAHGQQRAGYEPNKEE